MPSASSSPAHVPRPLNSFFVYRSDKLKELKADPSFDLILQRDISSRLGKQWRQEPTEVRNIYKEKAAELKAEHKRIHPDYRYHPRSQEEIAAKKKSKGAPKGGVGKKAKGGHIGGGREKAKSGKPGRRASTVGRAKTSSNGLLQLARAAKILDE